MAVKIWDSANKCFKDAATPKIHDAENEAWKESAGFVYNKEMEAWEEKWKVKPKKEIIYENGEFGIYGKPSIFALYNMGVGTVTFNSDNFYIVETSNAYTSCVIFPNKIDFSEHEYVYIEANGYSQVSGKNKVSLISTNYYGYQEWSVSSGAQPHTTNSLSGMEDVETTSRGYIRRIKCAESAKFDYLGVLGSQWFGDAADLTVYKIWIE